MDNIAKLKKISHYFYHLTSIILVVIPVYYAGYWAFINCLPETLLTINTPTTFIVDHKLTLTLRLIGFAVSIFPLLTLVYIFINIRKIFYSYKNGIIFSFDHVFLFKKTSKALIFWLCFSMAYESMKSILFSFGNPPGQRMLNISFGSAEIITLIIAGIIFAIAWVMDEGRILIEEQELTI